MKSTVAVAVCLVIVTVTPSPAADEQEFVFLLPSEPPRGILKRVDDFLEWPGVPAGGPTDNHGGNRPGECLNLPSPNACCELLGDPTCDDAPFSYNEGDDICISGYWTESVEVPVPDWVVTWSAALRVGSRLIPVFVNEQISFGPIDQPGDYLFCVAYSLLDLPSPRHVAAVEHGQRADTPGGSLPAALTNSFVVRNQGGGDPFFYRDEVDGGDAPKIGGCHYYFDDNICTLNKGFLDNDFCLRSGRAGPRQFLAEYTDTSCHQTGDITIYDCRVVCDDPAATCGLFFVFCPDLGSPLSARCSC